MYNCKTTSEFPTWCRWLLYKSDTTMPDPLQHTTHRNNVVWFGVRCDITLLLTRRTIQNPAFGGNVWFVQHGCCRRRCASALMFRSHFALTKAHRRHGFRHRRRTSRRHSNGTVSRAAEFENFTISFWTIVHLYFSWRWCRFSAVVSVCLCTAYSWVVT